MFIGSVNLVGVWQPCAIGAKAGPTMMRSSTSEHLVRHADAGVPCPLPSEAAKTVFEINRALESLCTLWWRLDRARDAGEGEKESRCEGEMPHRNPSRAER